MQLTLALAGLLTLASAQSFSMAPSTSSACAAQPVLESCLASTQAIVKSCASTDYNCLCSKWTDVLTCFNQCPSDARGAAVLSSQKTFCSNASAYPSPTTSAISAAVSSAYSAPTTGSTSAASAATGSSATARAASSSASGSQTSSAAAGSATAKSGAARREVVAGSGLVLGMVGFLGAVL